MDIRFIISHFPIKELKKKIKIIDFLQFIVLCQEDEGYYRGRTLTKKIIKEELNKETINI